MLAKQIFEAMAKHGAYVPEGPIADVLAIVEHAIAAEREVTDENSVEAQTLGRVCFEAYESWVMSLAPGELTQFSSPEQWSDVYEGRKRCWVQAAMAVVRCRLTVLK